ncbi:Frizzled-10-B [Hypsibius exemplaris]|uniref:Frizzled-10-B n=1 Tax=Hypsibius exemplaris TaxID=2072580 RepID=A0A1W0WUB2_HYPEX|nr:Frizzled-10-B [Hypsibius exemplaris]
MADRPVRKCPLYNGRSLKSDRTRPPPPPINHSHAMLHASTLALSSKLLLLIAACLTGGLLTGTEGLPMPAEAASASSQSQLSEWNPSQPQTCQRIDSLTTVQCIDMPYNSTTMPNFAGHLEVVEAVAALESFAQLKLSICASEELNVFLCSVYMPMCQLVEPTDAVVVIPPCRTLCRRVQNQCAPVMQGFGYTWPFDCAKFPEENKADQMCMPGETQTSPAATTSSNELADPDRCPRPEKKVYVQLNQTGSHNHRCALACYNSSLITSSEEKHYAEVFHGIVAGVTGAAALIVLLLLLSRRIQTTEQEKPVYMILLCLCLVAVGYAVRLVGGRGIGCSDTSPAYLVRGGMEMPNAGCVAVFVLLFYFGLAGNVWWLILTGVWFSAAVRERESAGVRKMVKRLHLFAWGLPAVLTGVGIAGKLIDTDELTAICYIGQQDSWNLLLLVIIPQATITLAGAAVLLTGFIQLTRRRQALAAKFYPPAVYPHLSTINQLTTTTASKQQSNCDERLFILAALFLPSTAIVIGCYVTDWYNREENLELPDRIHVALYFIRVVMQFVYGLVVTGWFCLSAAVKRKSTAMPVSSKQTSPLLPPTSFMPSFTATMSLPVVKPMVVNNDYLDYEPDESDLYNSVGPGAVPPSPSLMTASTQYYPVGHPAYDRQLTARMIKQQELSKAESYKRSYRSMAPPSESRI